VNEIVASASSGGTNETATDLVAIEAPPHSSSHQTDVQYMLADVFTTTYHMVAGYVFNSFASGDGTFWWMQSILMAPSCAQMICA